ncbi:MAG: type II toxin-antitoxin system VapC family toxin [Ignavibacteriota bacterium]|nr:MAG: type II toxin-antitoxin system VapC family toxin [Chlorobiota bacterium]MBE7477401.1 type II toxin-antitoxin system VapC family toxin [Ignavibacteriales bacterium]MBL1122802.1 type II toxin-antitoxin system VapC family toxin [Ignavibacteriota bacterium]MCE7855823.1 type II toxin-antitoxin system VapC family toxin [Ignavibacteria bacterium CHB3]MEB2296305.1 type II toxin-antitoxin system VapC family toxin [Ignavibacteria bacterium]GJQ40890.1 MAG: ribonuclease VapC [Ignavibacteriaceae ba
MKYLLDTNICIYIIKKKPESIIKIFSKIKLGDVAISAITIAELYFGLAKSSKPNENTIALQEFLQPLVTLDFNSDDAVVYGRIRAELEANGQMIGAMDLLIAAIALSRELILVTNNEKEFSRIKDLKLENWV